jgi:putative membrane protein
MNSTPLHHPRPFLRTAGAILIAQAAMLTASAQSDPMPGPPQPPGQSPVNPSLPSRPAEDFSSPTAPARPSRASERVLVKVAMLSAEGVRVSQVASQRANRAHVRSFADQVTSATRSLEQEIDQLAINNNILIPTGRDAEALASEEERWQRKDADDFDEDFVKRAVKIHRDTIEAFEDYVEDRNTDPAIAAVAQRYLPTLREHLRQAENLNSNLD